VEAGEASHGEMVGSRFGLGGARQEAARGFPSVFGCALPALRKARARGASVGQARLHALYSLAASLDDTNVYHRGGAQAARFLQDNAREFLVAGSVFAAGWRERAKALDAECVARRISPGGCADLLAATIFVDSLDADSRTAQ
jgi:triphosphoribosyl-dephospho-CoA synthase